MTGIKVITVHLDDDRTVKYTLRGLKDEEIQAWAQFCSSVFSYKDNAPAASYFERHYYNDPRREALLIRVAFTEEGKIVSSCRVFRKIISAGDGETLQAGGIGEVCTDIDHRKRGLSKYLLQDAIEIMKVRGMQISLLHAAPDFFPVYERGGGFVCSTSKWSAISISKSDLRSDSRVRIAEFPKDTERLMKLHQKYSENRFCGMIVRSRKYWNEYLSKELEGSLYVLEWESLIVGWLSVRPRSGRYQVREFGCDSTKISPCDAISVLLSRAMEGVDLDSFELQLPTAIFDEIREGKPTFVDGSTERSEDDLGWMYKALQEDSPNEITLTKNDQYPHLIWPADSF